MSHAMGGRPGRPRPTRDTYQPFLVKLKLKLQCYHFCLYGGLRRYNPERLRSHGHGHGRASGTPTPCSRRTPTAFGKAQLSTAPTRHRIPGWSDEVTCLAYLRVRVLCQPTLRPLGMAVSSHNPKVYFAFFRHHDSWCMASQDLYRNPQEVFQLRRVSIRWFVVWQRDPVFISTFRAVDLRTIGVEWSGVSKGLWDETAIGSKGWLT